MGEMEEHGEASPSRRRLIKTGVAATGVAFVAPQILNTAVAGAMTTTCYAFKLQTNNVCSGDLNPSGPNDPSCDAAFNSQLASAANAGDTLSLDCAAGAALVNVDSGGQGTNGSTISVTGDNCVLTFAGFKAANTCYANGDPSVVIAGDDKSVTFTTPGPQAISHMTFVVCCTGSPHG